MEKEKVCEVKYTTKTGETNGIIKSFSDTYGKSDIINLLKMFLEETDTFNLIEFKVREKEDEDVQ